MRPTNHIDWPDHMEEFWKEREDAEAFRRETVKALDAISKRLAEIKGRRGRRWRVMPSAIASLAANLVRGWGL